MTLIYNEMPQRDGAPAIAKTDMIDPHWYVDPYFFFRNTTLFDTYERGKYTVYVGEYACNRGVGGGNMLGALSEAAFIGGMERNGDLVTMASYAPLFENRHDRNWATNLIWIDSDRVMGRSSYYVQKMAAENRPDYNVKSNITMHEAQPESVGKGHLGLGASLEGGARTAPDESSRFAGQAVRGALADAGLGPHAVDWVPAHGTGTPLNDRSEAVLRERVFAQAEARPAVTALKSWIGHGSAACGGMELALMLAAWRSGRLPPIRNLRAPCSGLLDFAVATRPFPGPVGVLENFGFGGQNAALVVRCGDD